MRGFGECFADLPDPRAENALHDLTEILFIALLATLCGATSCTDMALFARMKAYLWQDVLVLKENQAALLQDARAAIRAAARKGKKSATTMDAAHGRKERRTAVVAPVTDMAQKHDFPGLRAVARITSKRGTDNTVERYFLMSQNYRPKDVMRIVRAHWTIENGLHWPLAVMLDEDLARNRKDNAPANLAVLRRLALNVARAHPDTKISLRAKLKRAGWNDAFLFDLLGHVR